MALPLILCWDYLETDLKYKIEIGEWGTCYHEILLLPHYFDLDYGFFFRNTSLLPFHTIIHCLYTVYVKTIEARNRVSSLLFLHFKYRKVRVFK